MRWADVIEGAPALPALPGGTVAPFPYLSGYGLMLRVTRLGAMAREDLTQMGLRDAASRDVLAETQQMRASARALLTATRLGGTRIADYWRPEVWMPAHLDEAWRRAKRPVRQCPSCARYGYHCAAFQVAAISHCPWHGDRLENACAKCGSPHSPGFDRRGRLGTCACRHDAFKLGVAGAGMWDFPTHAADAWLTQYLDWTAAARQNRWLVLPPALEAQEQAIEALVPPPRILQTPKAAAPVTEICGEGKDPRPQHFHGWCLLGGERPLTYLPLPAPLQPELSEATLAVATQLSPTVPIPLELCYSHGFEEARTIEDNVVNRADCFIAPVHRAAGGGVWLNLSAVDPGIPEFCGRLLASVTQRLNGNAQPLPTGRCSPHLEQSFELDGVRGRRHLDQALCALIVPAYRQGLEALLRTMAKVEWPPDQPWLVPAVELRATSGSLEAVRLVWVPIKAPRVRRVVEVPLPTASRPVGKRGRRFRGKAARRPPKAETATRRGAR
jgi:hypothetical protein